MLNTYTCLFENRKRKVVLIEYLNKQKIKISILDQLMMCDNLSLYTTYIPSPTTQLTTINPQFYPTDNDNDEHRPYMSIKRKLSGRLYRIESD